MVVAATIERLVQDAGAVTADGVSAEATAEGQLMRTLLDAFAQYERARIRARIESGRPWQSKRKRGEFLGEAPLGHVRGEDGRPSPRSARPHTRWACGSLSPS